MKFLAPSVGLVLSDLDPPTKSVSMNSQSLSNLGSPTQAADAATKNYVDTALTGRVSTSTSILAGTGLTGGGDLSASRTLSVAYGTAAGTAAQSNDARLSDARTPKAHASTHATGGSDPVTPSAIGAAPTAHTHTEADVTGLVTDLAAKVGTARIITAGTGLTGGGDLSADRTLTVAYGTTAGTAAQGNDSRLSDARTPLAHKSTHVLGGSDALAPGDIGAALASHTHTSFGDLSITGTLSVLAGGVVGADTWHTVGTTGQPAFQNSWHNNSSTDAQVGFLLDAMGFVRLRGVVAGGTTGATLGICFTLPTGYRPSGTQNFATAGAGGATAQIRITSDGAVAVVFGATTWNSLTGVAFSLTG
jgi:hypothetical protein